MKIDGTSQAEMMKNVVCWIEKAAANSEAAFPNPEEQRGAFN